MGRFEGKAAIVTGSSSGIGKSIALQMAREGAAVTVVADANVKGGEATACEITDLGGRAIFIQADVSREADCRNVAAKTIAAFGGVDILINNAGITRAKPLEEMAEEFWDHVIDTNLKSAYLMSRAVIENMLSHGGGAVVNISSVHAVLTHRHHAAYAASKAGMCGMTRALALEFAARGVRFNAVLPGATDISLHPRSAEAVDRTAWRPRNSEIQPTGRSGSPDEISEAVCFLASGAASYITGATLAVDGGLLAILRDR